MIIGICGKSGSGKSTLSNQIIASSNKPCIHLDIDKVGHQVLLIPEVKEELIKNFGEFIINENIVNRKKLGEIVFNSRIEMDKLSDITWKYMQIEIDKFINEHKDKNIILDWILLPITKYFEKCDIKILLDVPYEVRKERAIKRDNISNEAFDLRELSSIEFNKNEFDYIFNNTEEDIKRLVKLL